MNVKLVQFDHVALFFTLYSLDFFGLFVEEKVAFFHVVKCVLVFVGVSRGFLSFFLIAFCN